MGADTTSTHLIFFIAATVVAAGAAGALTTVVLDISGKVDVKGRALGEVITTDVRIVNDPSMVPNDPVVIYVKNTGSSVLDASLLTLLVDGQAVVATAEVIGRPPGTTAWRPGEVVALTHAAQLDPSDDHQARVVTSNGVHDELRFRVV